MVIVETLYKVNQMFKLCGQTYSFDVNGLVWRIYFERTQFNDWKVTADNGNLQRYELGRFAMSANTEKFCKTMLSLLVDNEFIQANK